MRPKLFAALFLGLLLAGTGARAQAPFAAMGPLAGQLAAGTSGAWTLRDDAGQLQLVNDGKPDAIRFYATGWQGSLDGGRSVSVRVRTGGAGGAGSAAGLVFRQTDADPRWLAFVLGADGKLGLYARLPTELRRTGTFDVPGGHRDGGDVLTINQKGDTAQLLVNGVLLRELATQDGLNPNAPAPVGVIAMGTGRFTLDGFGFGPALVPVAPPGAGGHDDTVPGTGSAAAPPPRDDTVPNAPAAGGRQAGDVLPLGPLGHGFNLGDDAGWHFAVTGDHLVVTHHAEDDLYYFNRSMRWDKPDSLRSAAVTVTATGDTRSSGAGLVFGLSADGQEFWQFLLTGDDKLKLFHLKDNQFTVARTFDSAASPGAAHRLSVVQTATTLSLVADGKLLGTMESSGEGFAPEGRVGVGLRGNGEFQLSGFTIGTDPAPTERAVPQTVEVPALGPLGHSVRLGLNSGWNTSVGDDGSIAYAHTADDEAGWFYRTIGWPAPATADRSASITVQVDAQDQRSGGGLTFGLRADSSKLLMFVVAGDGKARLLRMANNKTDVLATFNPAPPPSNGRRRVQVSRRGDTVGLFVDGTLMRSFPAAELGDMEGDVGLGIIGRGQYRFRDFTFGPPIGSVPAQSPARPPGRAPGLVPADTGGTR